MADTGPWVETASCDRCGRVYSSSSDVSRAAAQGGATNQANTCVINHKRADLIEAGRAERRRQEAARQEQLRQERENRRNQK